MLLKVNFCIINPKNLYAIIYLKNLNSSNQIMGACRSKNKRDLNNKNNIGLEK